MEHFIDHKEIIALQELTSGDWQPKQIFSGGSGFYIKEGFILTNAHVIDHCNEVRADYGYHRVEVVGQPDLVVDLALLQIPYDLPTGMYPGSASFRSESTPLKLGESVAVFGYPLSSKLSYDGNFTIGNVSSKEGPPTEITPSDKFQFTAPIQHGNSGGPVLDSGGNVAGVVVSYYSHLRAKEQIEKEQKFNVAQNINFAVSLKAINGFLRKTGVEPDSGALGVC